MYIECVPNISEGKDIEKIERIVDAAQSVEDCVILGVEPDADYNRTVITIAGLPENVYEGAKALVLKAIEEIDMNTHKGEHPRMGAVDVCPFVPLDDSMMETCVILGKRLAEEIEAATKVPTFLYGFAASSDERRLLSALRKGQYEGLIDRFTDNHNHIDERIRFPDFGEGEWNDIVARSGCITIGARDILIAYNVNVHEKDAKVSKLIGSLVRSSGRLMKDGRNRKTRLPGLLTKVQGMGVPLERLGISQVSMNLLDRFATPLHIAYLACKSIASDHDVTVEGSEIVGLVPLQSMIDAGQHFCTEDDLSISELVECAIEGLGLREFHEFHPNTHIIEWAIEKELSN